MSMSELPSPASGLWVLSQIPEDLAKTLIRAGLEYALVRGAVHATETNAKSASPPPKQHTHLGERIDA